MPADRDDPDHDRRLGDHTHRNGFDADILGVAVNAVADAEDEQSDAAAVGGGVTTLNVAAQFPPDARFSEPREAALLLRAAAARGHVRRNVDLAGTDETDGQPVERWATPPDPTDGPFYWGGV